MTANNLKIYSLGFNNSFVIWTEIHIKYFIMLIMFKLKFETSVYGKYVSLFV